MYMQYMVDAGIVTEVICSRSQKASQLHTPGPQNKVIKINCYKVKKKKKKTGFFFLLPMIIYIATSAISSWRHTFN